MPLEEYFPEQIPGILSLLTEQRTSYWLILSFALMVFFTSLYLYLSQISYRKKLIVYAFWSGCLFATFMILLPSYLKEPFSFALIFLLGLIFAFNLILVKRRNATKQSHGTRLISKRRPLRRSGVLTLILWFLFFAGLNHVMELGLHYFWIGSLLSLGCLLAFLATLAQAQNKKE